MGVVYCVDPKCEKLYTGAEPELQGLNYFDENARLPCGHKPAMIVMAASSLRDDHKIASLVEDAQRKFCFNVREAICEACPDNMDCKKYFMGKHTPFEKGCKHRDSYPDMAKKHKAKK